MSPSRQDSTTQWVQVLQLGGTAASAFRVELAMAAGDARSLANGGRFARVLQARLVGPGDTTERLLALKMQRDVVRPVAAAGAFGELGNEGIEAAWQREFEQLRAMAGERVPRLVAFGADGGRLGPLAFDRRRGTLFRVVGPRHFAPLRTCCDDARLRQLGLEPWSTTTARFLVESGAASGVEPGDVFYTWSAREGAAVREGVTVRRGHALFCDLAVAWAAASAARREELAAALPDLAAVLADLRPEDVEARIVPVAFYEAWAWCTEWCELHFGEFCDLAGGAPAEVAIPVAAPMPRAELLAPLVARLTGEQQWWTAPWTTAAALGPVLADDVDRLRQFALESTCLKLQACVQVMQAVEAFHARGGEPHFGVSVDNVMMAWAGDTMAPARWGFRARLVDLGASHRAPLRGIGHAALGGNLCLPSPEIGATALSLQLTAACPTALLGMSASATPLEVDGVLRGLRIELQSRDPLPPIVVGDFVRIVADAALPGLGDQPLFAQVTGVRRGVVSVECRQDEPAPPWPRQPFVFTASVQRFRRLGPASDLFGLGMLLARALLVTDERDAGQVREAWDSLLDRLDVMSGGNGFVDTERTAAALRTLLRSGTGVFGSDSVLWSRALREVLPLPLPAHPWQRLVSLITRMAIASPLADQPGAPPASPVTPFRREAEELLDELRVELAEAPTRAAVIRSAATELLGELRGAGGGA